MSLSREQWMQAGDMLRELFEHGTQQQRVRYASMYFEIRKELDNQAVAAPNGETFKLPVKRARAVKPADATPPAQPDATPSAQPDETTHVNLSPESYAEAQSAAAASGVAAARGFQVRHPKRSK